MYRTIVKMVREINRHCKKDYSGKIYKDLNIVYYCYVRKGRAKKCGPFWNLNCEACVNSTKMLCTLSKTDMNSSFWKYKIIPVLRIV